MLPKNWTGALSLYPKGPVYATSACPRIGQGLFPCTQKGLCMHQVHAEELDRGSFLVPKRACVCNECMPKNWTGALSLYPKGPAYATRACPRIGQGLIPCTQKGLRMQRVHAQELDRGSFLVPKRACVCNECMPKKWTGALSLYPKGPVYASSACRQRAYGQLEMGWMWREGWMPPFLQAAGEGQAAEEGQTGGS